MSEMPLGDQRFPWTSSTWGRCAQAGRASQMKPHPTAGLPPGRQGRQGPVWAPPAGLEPRFRDKSSYLRFSCESRIRSYLREVGPHGESAGRVRQTGFPELLRPGRTGLQPECTGAFARGRWGVSRSCALPLACDSPRVLSGMGLSCLYSVQFGRELICSCPRFALMDATWGEMPPFLQRAHFLSLGRSVVV